MTEEQIGNILRVIGTANVSEEQRGSATADVLQLAAETFTKQVFTSLLSAKPNEIKREEEKAPQQPGRQKTGIRFTKQEMKKMPMKYRKNFRARRYHRPLPASERTACTRRACAGKTCTSKYPRGTSLR